MSSPTSNRRVLVVDDNHAIHADFRKILAPQRATPAAFAAMEAELFGDPAMPSHDRSFDLVSAYQGAEGYTRVREAAAAGAPFAVAFVDMRMPPGWDGLETIEKLWSIDRDLQVVICTAYSDHSWEELHARLGERDNLLIVRKPFDPIEIVQAAHALAAKWDATRVARARAESLDERLSEELRHRDRIEAELRLAQKLESVGQLATGIAHEINTPIQFVMYNLEAVRTSIADLVQLSRDVCAAASRHACGELGRELEVLMATADFDYLCDELPGALDAMREGLARIARIVRAMRELSHGGLDEASPCDVNRALENALVVTANEYRDVADVETDLAELPAVIAQEGPLNQVLLNLIVNAAHAMYDLPQRGRLSVKSRVDGNDVVISIADTGCGIPDAIRDRVFDPFFTTKEVGRGTGQGLAISRSIVVDRHRGTLTFDSAIGRGTTFYVRLPIHRSEAA